jgi:hypothetical protein
MSFSSLLPGIELFEAKYPQILVMTSGKNGKETKFKHLFIESATENQAPAFFITLSGKA